MTPNHEAVSPTRKWHWIVLALVILFVIAVRIRWLNIPLERDEGEFAYVAQLMLEGVVPYKLAYVIKLPGTSAVYALSMALFGQTALGIHLGLLLANVAGVVLLFFLARLWFDADVAIIASATYALMSLSWGVNGTAAHATQFIVPAMLGAYLLLFKAFKSERLAPVFASGFLFGLAFILKQPGLIFGAYAGLVLVEHELKVRPGQWRLCLGRSLVFCAGLVLPFAALCLLFWRAGVFERFWHWSFTVAGGVSTTSSDAWDRFVWYAKWLIVSWQWPFWFLAALALPVAYALPRPGQRPGFFFLGFFVVSVFAGALGFRFIPHYFVLTLPALAILLGLGVRAFSNFSQKSAPATAPAGVPVKLFAVLCAGVLFADKAYLFTGPPDRLARLIYKDNPFASAVGVADYIRKNSTPGSQVAVLGSEPEVCFYAHRRSATGHLSTYILMEGRPYSHEMQLEMLREIEAAQPEYIVMVNCPYSWLAPPGADPTLLQAMSQYEKKHYTLVGVADDGSAWVAPQYYWGLDVTNADLTALPNLAVYKRNGPASANQPKS